MFVYLFGYMIVHYGVLRRAERALAAGDMDTVEQIINKHIPHWSRGILKVTGVSLSVEGLENIPKDRPCVFVANHRSYYDIPLLLAGLEKPHGILAKEELEKIPLLNRWMKLLGCVFVQRDDLRASVRALNDATAIVESGRSFIIFPEGTRTKPGITPTLHRGAAQIAVRTDTPIEVIQIESSDPWLTKGAPWYAVPPRKPIIRLSYVGRLTPQPLEDPEAAPAAARSLTAKIFASLRFSSEPAGNNGKTHNGNA